MRKLSLLISVCVLLSGCIIEPVGYGYGQSPLIYHNHYNRPPVYYGPEYYGGYGNHYYNR